MFFKNKYIITCSVYCSNRETIYGADDDGKNKYINMYSFTIKEPEHLNNKVLYDYDEDSNKYTVGEEYTAKLNTKTGEFTI